MSGAQSGVVETLYQQVSSVLQSARNTVYQVVNAEMVKAYWAIGQLLVENEQNGEGRAA